MKNGKPAKLKDLSMTDAYHDADEEDGRGVVPGEGVLAEGNTGQGRMGENGLLDLSDRRNDEFIYVY